MSYCPHCDDNVQLVQKKNLSKAAAKGVLSATHAATGMLNNVYDKSEYESDKSQFSRYEAEKRNYERTRNSQSLSNLSKGFNNKVVDMAIPDDYYFACASCDSEISFPQCESRPEYLGMSYDTATARSGVVFAFMTLFVAALGLRPLIQNEGKVFLVSLVLAAVSYFSVRFIPFKPRGVLNLISENIKTFFVGLFGVSLISMIGMIVINAVLGNGVAASIAAVVFLGGVTGGSLYFLFLMNKQRWAEIKETWKLMDQLEAQEAHEESVDKNAA